MQTEEPRLLRQSENLRQFVSSNAKRFDLLQYEPWTHGGAPSKQHVRVAESLLLPGSLGVFPSKPLKPGKLVCIYPGVLMWNELADEFSLAYHCPTAVRITILDYFVNESIATKMKLSKDECFDKARRKAKKKNLWQVRITLVGDPSSAGPIINSPFRTAGVANCKLEVGRPEMLKQYRRKHGSKWRISSTIVTATRLECEMDPEGELLLHYDESEHADSTKPGEFWNQLESDVARFCDHCFSKRFDHDGQPTSLIGCSDCLASRHYGCFAGCQLWTTVDRKWYCPEHQQNCFELPKNFHRAMMQFTPPSVPSGFVEVATAHASSSASSSRKSLSKQLASVDQPGALDRSSRIRPRIQCRVSAPSIEQDQLDAIVLSRQELCSPDWLGIRAVEDLWVDPKLPCPLGAFNDGTEPIEAGRELLIYGGEYALTKDMKSRDSSYTRRLANTGSTGCIDGSRVAAGFVRFSGSIQQVCKRLKGDFEPTLADAASPAALAEWLRAPRGAMVNSAINRTGKVANCKYGRLQGVSVTLAPVECVISIARIMPGDELCVGAYHNNEEKAGFPSKPHAAEAPVESNRALCHSPRSAARFRQVCLAATPPSTPLQPRVRVARVATPPSTAFGDSESKESDDHSASLSSSDSSSSDSSSSDSSSSDSEMEDAQESRTASSHELVAAGSRRSTAVLSIPLRRLTKVAITDAGLLDLRAVWKEFTPIIEAAAKKKRSAAKWHHTSAKDGSHQEQHKARSLAADWMSIVECCGSTANVVALTVAGRVTVSNSSIFSSCTTLLRARLKWFEVWSFNKQNQQVQLKQMMRNPLNDFRGFPLCAKCLFAAVGMSRSTAFRVQARSDFHGVLATEAKIGRKGGRFKLVVSLLRQTLATEQQHLPTGSSGQTKRAQSVLSYTTQESCRDMLQTKYNMLHGVPLVIAQSTFHRALRWLEKEQNVRINVQLQKLVARCSDCTRLEGAHKSAKAEGTDRVQILLTQRAFYDHLSEAFEQRAFFDEKKAYSLRWPWLLWTLTLDGFDQAKTRMPSIKRGGKAGAVDRSNTLGVRVVGAFVFGAPVPCIGMSSFEDIPTKGGDASVTCFEKALDMQWEVMDVNRPEPIPYETSEAAVTVRAAKVAAVSSSVAPVNPPANVDLSVSKVPFIWPEGLHVTFDNAGSDCKNRFFFRFLAALVGLGVFMYITVSTLLVGHTHDIVDQMFGVWSTELKRESAPSLEAMHRVFRKKYSTQIYVLQDMLNKMEKQKQEAKAAAAADNADDASGPARSSAKPEPEELTPAVADYLVRLSCELGVQPQMVLMQFTVNLASWAPEVINDISVPHCFLIQKEKVPLKGSKLGDVEREDGIMMYSRFLAQSWNNEQVHHDYPNVRFGPWTTRKVLMRMSELPANDPFLYPPQYVDVRPARACMQQHVNDALFDTPGMNTNHQKEFTASLDRLESQFEALDDHCAECAEYAKEINLVGPIHRPTDAEKNNPAIKARADEQHTLRETLRAAVSKHLASKPHAFLEAKGWWTKWIKRANDVIRPYYIKRKILAEADAPLQSGRLVHPRELPRDKAWTAPIWRPRVAEEWALEHPPPKVNQFVAVRGDKANEPFWLGKLTSVPHLEAEDSEFEVKANLKSESKAVPSVKPPSRGLKRVAKQQAKDYEEKEEEEEEEEEEQNSDSDEDMPQGKSTLRTKASNSKSAAAAKPSKKTARPRLAVDRKQAAANLSKQAAAAAPSKSGAQIAVALAGLKTAARKKRAAEKAIEESADPHSKPAARKSKAAKLKAGQDASSSCHAKDKYNIVWMDYKQDTVASTRLMPLDMDRWKEKMTDSGCLEEWNVAVDRFQRGSFARVPEAALLRWQDIQFLSSKRSGVVAFDQLIFWTSKEELLTKDGTVRQKFFSKLVEDLAEASEVRHKVSADYDDPPPKKIEAESKMDEE